MQVSQQSNQSKNCVLLIADLHLITGNNDKTKLFIKFLQNQATTASQVFILGDLFNTWLGDDVSIDNYQQTINALKNISAHIKISIMVGNRDFLLSDKFSQESGCDIITEPYILNTPNKQYVLIHGDSLCADDVNYQRLKKILRYPLTKYIFLKLSKNIRLKISAYLRTKSINATNKKPAYIMDVNTTATTKFMQQYPQADLIHGHTHRQNTHKELEYTRYVLGDWKNNQGNAIKIDNNLSWLEID